MEDSKIIFSPGAYFGIAAGILILPIEWLISGIAAAAFHECSHLAALKLCKITVRQIRIGFRGARIVTGALTPIQELFCAAAGPIGSLSLLILVRWLPILAAMGFAQGLFNLLPIYPLDGGRILRSIFLLAKTRH